MRKELEEKLIKRFPTWFSVNDDARPSLAFPFRCGDGWFETVWRLCVDLEPMVPKVEQERGESFKVLQVREKFGRLRFYVSHYADATNERIFQAVKEAFHTCEVCGQRGQQFDRGDWVRVRCDEHGYRGKAE